MFNKKKKKEATPVSYSNWEVDFGFLNTIMNRKIILAQQYDIAPLAAKLVNNNDFIRDEDIKPIYYNVVESIYSSLSPDYINFLVSKYFSGQKAFIAFISETVLNELIKSGLSSNNDKIKNKYSSEFAEKLMELNNKKI